MQMPPQIGISDRLYALRPPVLQSVTGWLLIIPLLFLSVRGITSLQDSGSGSDFAGLVPGRHLGIMGYAVIPGIAYSVVAYVIAINFGRVITAALKMKMLTILAILTIASALWSQDPFRSLYNGAFYLIGTFFAFYLVLRFDTEDIMSLLVMTGILVSVASIALVAVAPGVALDFADPRSMGAWKGIFFQKNAAAKCLVYFLTPALVSQSVFSSTWKRVGYILLIGFFIAKTHVVTAVLLVFVYGTVMWGLRLLRRLERTTASLIALTTCISIVVGTSLLLPFLPDILRALGRDPTLTGRTVVWSVLMHSVLKHPLLGYGFYAFWRGVSGESANAIMAVHWFFGYAHNGMLEIVLQLGLVGLGLFLVTLVQAVRNAIDCCKYGCFNEVEWYIGIIVLAILYNIDEATVVWPNDLLSILYIVACFGLARTVHRIKKERRLNTQPYVRSSLIHADVGAAGPA